MRPAILCKLKKETLIDANPGFVDTFNWLVDFCNNLKGDGEIDNAKPLSLDRTIDDQPVLRFDKDKAKADAAGTIVRADGCYSLSNSAAEGETPFYSFTNCYYKAGGILYPGASASGSYSNCFVALQVDASNPASSSIITYGSFSAMHQASLDEEYIIIPLYSFDSNGNVACDLRLIPSAQVIEVL